MGNALLMGNKAPAESRKLMKDSITFLRQIDRYGEWGLMGIASSYGRYKSVFNGDFLEIMASKAKRTKLGERVRFLDLGPGKGEYLTEMLKELKVYSGRINPEGKYGPYELHTLEAKYINSKNPAKRHIGYFETYNTGKLGKFDIIVDEFGPIHKGKCPTELIVKTIDILKVGGALYLVEARQDSINKVKRILGDTIEIKNFDVDTDSVNPSIGSGSVDCIDIGLVDSITESHLVDCRIMKVSE